MKLDTGTPPLGSSSTPPTTGAAGGFGMGPAGNAPCPPAGPPPLNGPEVGQTVQGCPKLPPPVPPKPIRIRISLFFDGTGNNRTNAALGTAFSKDASYNASATNIALLESAGLVGPGGGDDAHLKVYTEGIGTQDREGDSELLGFGLGKGKTGTIAKVEKGIAEAISQIRFAAAGREISRLHIDTFGFSRGAAAARYCIWACMEQPGQTMRERLVAADAKVGAIEIKFVGLYDSVASHGHDHNDDTAELHQDAIAAAAKVVHLAAAEEHRENFRLTNINSAGGKGRQFFLPGAHSDVGGGYNVSEDELDWEVFRGTGPVHVVEALPRDMAWLVAAGWYRADELTHLRGSVAVRANRRGISNAYSRIPLRLMAEFARENGVNIKPTLEAEHPVPSADPVMQQARAAITNAVSSGRCTQPEFWFSVNPASDPAWHKALRHGYLHFSAQYNGIGLDPQWADGGSMCNQRRRIIQNG